MSGVWLHLVGRELRLGTRLSGLHRRRCVAVICLTALAVWSILAPQSALTRGAKGHLGFTVVATVLGFFSLLSGLRHAALWLSEEHQHGSLALLFQANASSTHVVLGGFAAAFLKAFYELLTCLPLLLIPITMGGTSVLEAGRMTLVLLTFLFISVALGTANGALWRGERRALAGTVVCLFAVAVWLPLAGKFWASFFPWPERIVWWWSLSPVASFQLAVDPAFQAAPIDFGRALLYQWLLAVALLVVACLGLRRRFSTSDPQAATAAVLSRWRQVLRMGTKTWWQPSPGETLHAAIRSSEARPRARSLWLASLMPVVALAASFYALTRGYRSACETALVALYAAHLQAKALFAVEAGCLLHEERRAGTLLLELTTVRTAEEVVQRHGQELRRRFRWPMCLAMGANLCLLGLVCFLDHPPITLEERMLLVAGLIFGSAAMLIDARSICWHGLWSGLSGTRTSSALLRTFASILLLPLAVVWLLVTLNLGNLFTENEVVAYALCWVVLGLAASLMASATAKHRLAANLRACALPHTEALNVSRAMFVP